MTEYTRADLYEAERALSAEMLEALRALKTYMRKQSNSAHEPALPPCCWPPKCNVVDNKVVDHP